MGTKGKAIVGMDVIELINLLNKAFADEWLAYYQYWIGTQIVKGPMREVAIAELTEHTADELRHAQILSDRIIQLGGTPLTDPIEWNKMATCAYLKPTDFSVRAIIKQGVHGEQCAIDVYTRLLAKTKNTDPVTYQLLISILADEVDHEEDFESLLEDLAEIEMKR
ncbi:ferritin [Candidatus Acetothermia bacterium]|nr:ferritin [Candidatus Acetothermia bacterium]MCI2426950.1 ferritin [Candidatus Acetothermia bacterium]